MMMLRILKWGGGLLVVLALAVVTGLALFGGNWLREPIQALALERTGRSLEIGGDLRFSPGWPLLRIAAAEVKFGNPPWAAEKHMLTADRVEFSVNLPALFTRRIALEVLALRHARIALETNEAGQKNWLLDRKQQDEGSSLKIARLALEKSRISYDDPGQKTHVEAEVSTREASSPVADVVVDAQGRYRGLPFTAHASGGPLLALRDRDSPYPFKLAAKIGRTTAQAEGSVTSLSELAALDIKVDVGGDSLAQLFPLLRIALPETGPYRTAGRITHEPGFWRYQEFTARIGHSNLSGTLQVDSGGKRPFLHGELEFGKLDLADLGPVIGSRPDSASAAEATSSSGAAAGPRRVLPDRPFRTERWASVDADIKLSAGTIVRAKALPIERLSTRLQMRDSVLTLEPLEFAIAGGTLAGVIRLDGQQQPIRSQARLTARKLAFSQLFPAAESKKTRFGQITGDIDLSGSGNSVGRMLATANGRGGVVIDGGEISRLTMEMAGLHLLEIITLKLAGDRPIRIRCGMADFTVRDGIVQTNQLVFDTAITNIQGRGQVDLAREKLDLTLMPESKEISLIALRSPIYVRGSFAEPAVDVDKGRLAVRGLGALALGAANPLLALAPLIEAGPGLDSDCGRLLSARPKAKSQ